MKQLLDEGRLELVGGTYNEPNTNLTASETTIRNLVYGVSYQRDVHGRRARNRLAARRLWPRPAVPRVSPPPPASPRARGPAAPSMRGAPTGCRRPPSWSDRRPGRMNLPGSNSPRSSSGWRRAGPSCSPVTWRTTTRLVGGWMPLPTWRRRRRRPTPATSSSRRWPPPRTCCSRSGSDYTPPNKWVTEIARDWNSRYVSPHYVVTTPRRFFAAVRAEAAREESTSAARPGT